MQLKNKITSLFAVIVIFSGLISSCSDMNELSDRFMNKGETIYAAMIDTALVGTGEGRLKIEMHVKTNRVDVIRIYWNDANDSIDVEVNNQTGIFTKTIENLNEREYLFNIISFDKFGNKSMPYEISGRVYGENYKRTLINRNITSINASNTGEKIVIWGNIDTSTLDAKFNEIIYTNSDDEEVSLRVPISEQSTTIPDLKPGSLIVYRTVYIPDEMELDIFYTDFRESTPKYEGDYLLDKSEITIIGFSNQHDSNNNAARNAFDNNYNNRWHSQGSANYPHWMAFDINGDVLVSRFSIWPSVYDLNSGETYDNRLPAEFTLWGRNDEPGDNLSDHEGWTRLGEYSCENRGGEQTFVIENPIPVRYFKMYAPRGLNGTTMMVIGEFDIYCK